MSGDFHSHDYDVDGAFNCDCSVFGLKLFILTFISFNGNVSNGNIPVHQGSLGRNIKS